MTEISRSIEISAPREKVWSQIDPSNWTKIFNFIKEVDGFADGHAGVGTHATVVAGAADGATAIKYNIEITEFKEKERIAFRRYGGPLSGRGIMELRTLQKGTLFVRTSYYDDDLSEQTIKTLSEGMEKDNKRIKERVENSK